MLLEIVGVVLIIGLLAFAWREYVGPRSALRSLSSLRANVAASSQDASRSAGDSAPEPEEPLVDPAVLGDLGDPPPSRTRYPHVVPQKGDAVEPAEHSFRFEGEEYTISVDVDEQIYWGAVASERVISTTVDETEDQRNAVSYRYLAQDPLQAQVIADACDALRKAAKRRGLGRDRYAEFIAKYVQTMPYDFEKLSDPSASPRFPVETLVDETGVCSDKSLLMAALLAHEGYEVSLLEFDDENHMAVGIKGPGRHYRSSGYLFVESTSPAYVGEIPGNFVSGIQLTSEALVIPIGTGQTAYGAADRTARIVKVRDGARPAAEAMRSEAEGRVLTMEQAKKINAKLKLAYDSQFKLSMIEDHEDEYLDAKKAIRWIDKNAWWD